MPRAAGFGCGGAFEEHGGAVGGFAGLHQPAYWGFGDRAGLRGLSASDWDWKRLYESEPGALAADAHPDYLSTKYALERVSRAGPAAGLRLVRVQHHVAHVLSCMAENELSPPVLGVSWDGTGYGMDGTVWAGSSWSSPRLLGTGWPIFAAFHCRVANEPSKSLVGPPWACFSRCWAKRPWIERSWRPSAPFLAPSWPASGPCWPAASIHHSPRAPAALRCGRLAHRPAPANPLRRSGRHGT